VKYGYDGVIAYVPLTFQRRGHRAGDSLKVRLNGNVGPHRRREHAFDGGQLSYPDLEREQPAGDQMAWSYRDDTPND
jgi:hypothetical protein